MIRQTFPEAQAIDDPVARLTALTADQRRKLRHVAKIAPLHTRNDAHRLLGIIADCEDVVAKAGAYMAPIYAEMALTRLGPNGLGPAIDGYARFYGAL